MNRLQSYEDWRTRTTAVQEALATVQRCLREAPTVQLIPGERYRITMAGTVTEGDPVRLDDVGDFTAAARTRTITGRYVGRLPAMHASVGGVAARGLLVVQLEGESRFHGKQAVFADMDVLEYERIGVQA